ncbi:MAG: hypothetical protein UV46_C0059G0009 [Candidatus Gottesmanbacteria bacterium GW2011_GWC2_42_8]|nr:MAG: hypothetical protein UV46_C0059G0009 [Candidatus Gottesmanbacteria bacterium GW2011_GWC2_42_8]
MVICDQDLIPKSGTFHLKTNKDRVLWRFELFFENPIYLSGSQSGCGENL